MNVCLLISPPLLFRSFPCLYGTPLNDIDSELYSFEAKHRILSSMVLSFAGLGNQHVISWWVEMKWNRSHLISKTKSMELVCEAGGLYSPCPMQLSLVPLWEVQAGH